MDKPAHTIAGRLTLSAAAGVCAWEASKLVIVLITIAARDPVHRFPVLIGALAATVTIARLCRPRSALKPKRPKESRGHPMAIAAVTTQIPEDERQATAGHEAAHLVAAVAFGVPVTEIGVRSERTLRAGFNLTGHILYDASAQPVTPESAWASLVTTLAGNAYDRANDDPGFLSTVDFDTAHRVSGELYRYRAVLPAVENYSSADDIFDQAFAAATTFVTTHATVIADARARLLDHLAAADTDVLTDPAALRQLADTITARLRTTSAR